MGFDESRAHHAHHLIERFFDTSLGSRCSCLRVECVCPLRALQHSVSEPSPAGRLPGTPRLGSLLCSNTQIRLRAIIRAAICSAAMITVRFVGVEGMSGKIDASITRRSSTPRTAPEPVDDR